jgi:hypothetical protein
MTIAASLTTPSIGYRASNARGSVKSAVARRPNSVHFRTSPPGSRYRACKPHMDELVGGTPTGVGEPDGEEEKPPAAP